MVFAKGSPKLSGAAYFSSIIVLKHSLPQPKLVVHSLLLVCSSLHPVVPPPIFT